MLSSTGISPQVSALCFLPLNTEDFGLFMWFPFRVLVYSLRHAPIFQEVYNTFTQRIYDISSFSPLSDLSYFVEASRLKRV